MIKKECKNMANIGEKILQRRKALGWTQEELAFRMGYKSKSTINKIELGINDIPQSKVVKFAEVLNVTVAYLMDWEKEQKKNDTLSDIIIRMRTDSEFLSVVESLYNLDSEKLAGVKHMLSAFQK
jgi:transcriptional regulator with XRE-family HTH domain